jgi:DNA polymerase-1
MDRAYYSKEFLERHEEIKQLAGKILNSDECRAFHSLTREDYDFTPEHTRTLLYRVMGLEKEKFTESGLESVDASVLASINSQTLKDIIHYRKLEKVRNTYIAQFLREIDDDGRMRPNYNMHKVQTYRSSSSNPNFQNVPVRDQEAKKISRSGVIPSKGNLILDWDYGAMEFKIVTALSQDPVMVAYCHDPKTDIHRDTAGEVFAIDTSFVTKDMRFHTKNGMVFPTIYGSFFKNTAKNIFSATMNLPTGHPEKITVKEYLYEIGVLKSIKSPEADFEAHMKEVEANWWGKFKVLKQWQERQWKDYIEKGYLSMPFGFRAEGYLSRNEIINYPVQGTAFHCLIWSMNHIRQAMLDVGMLSFIIGQIHDNLLYDCCPEEKKEIVEVSTHLATERIRQQNPWIIVPLAVEWEETDVDGSWYSKKDLAA